MGPSFFDGNEKGFLFQYGKTVFRGCKEQYRMTIKKYYFNGPVVSNGT